MIIIVIIIASTMIAVIIMTLTMLTKTRFSDNNYCYSYRDNSCDYIHNADAKITTHLSSDANDNSENNNKKENRR